MRVVLRILSALLMLIPLVASADSSPQVVLATPGVAGGAIERFTVRFSDPIVPLGDPRAEGPFKVTCSTGGVGRWVDQRTYVWDFERPLPGGQTCAFDLRDGLTSLAGVDIGGKRDFAVDSGGPKARAVLPSEYGSDIEEDQVFLVAANMAPDPASVAANAYCAVDGIGEKIAVDVLKPAVVTTITDGLGPDRYELSNFFDNAGLPTTLPKAAADKARALGSVVALKCRRPLPPGRDMALVWGAGISANGRTAGADQRFDFTVRKEFAARFECGRVNPRAGCSPVEKAWVRFTAPIPRAQAQAIRIALPGGKQLEPVIEDKSAQAVSEIAFATPLPAATGAQLILPANIRDESGRALTNAQRFPLDIRFDQAPPLVKFAAGFGILEAAEGGVLPVTVRNVEPALQGRNLGVAGESLRIDASDGEVAKWLRDIDDAGDDQSHEEKHGEESVTINDTGAKPLLGSAQGAAFRLDLPGKGKDFEVVGIPLKKPGFYVVELASPGLGRALLGREAPRYVAAGALVTNMSVHFKWGRGASLAWVTALDSGKPVAGADVRITDSCTGKPLARGASDASGRLLIRGGLPEPETYGGCEGENASHPLMVSARANGDFSFTLTAWSEGIRPYDFDLPYGYSASDEIVHTVFDRTLIRAGETINMKHILRKPIDRGFAYGAALSGTLKLVHRGSGTEFALPLTIGKDGIGETSWTAPPGAPQGDYDLTIVTTDPDKTIDTGQSFRVDEFRLPTMRASVSGPRTAAIRPKSLPIDLFVGYLSGGGASSLPVRVRTAFTQDNDAPDGWEGWTFGGKAIVEGTTPLDGDGDAIEKPLPPASTLPVTLDPQGSARTSIDIPAAIDGLTTMAVEMDYEDANGEVLTASSRIPLYPSAVRLGLKSDGWLMKQDDLRLQLVALDTEGHPLKGQKIEVTLYSREVLTARRRLIGGFYAYDNQARVSKIDASCSATTDAQGLARCSLDPGVSGEVYAVATTTDADGNVSRSVQSVWLAGDDDWWFGGDNGDRMDLVAEAKEYPAGGTARLQVRMPFRAATALVTVEREGVLSSFVTQLSGKDPVIEVPMPGAYAPDVYVSVLAVRGRVGGWRLWLADLARRWHLPFFSQEGARPTALVDLAKPSYRLGIAKLKVGWEGHRLAVAVKADRSRYGVRETALVDVAVRDPGGKPAATAEIAFAAVDEALLQLSPNQSWDLIDAMMKERPLSVLTSTAQTQVVGKRHYGKKTAEPGGGGGGDLSGMTREDFRPVLLWKGRVRLDARGHARIPVKLADQLSAFKLVAIATDGPALFGTGMASVRTTQDLTLYSGIPPLVRSGDRYAATFTLRNGTDKPMTVTANVAVEPRIATGRPLTVTIPAGAAAPVTWMLDAPAGSGTLKWTVAARDASGRAADRVAVEQQVIPLDPIETWATAITRVGEGGAIPIAAPAGAIPGRGSIDIRLSPTLAPPMAGVRAYMADYPYNCFEQRLSRAIATGDAGAWARLASEMPAYQDRDGLIRYFPIDGIDGSEALTAYVLSITSEAGLAIPKGPRSRMIEALQAIVDGRLRREGQGAGDQRFQRVAALAALARAGAATPPMLGQVGIAPGDMPTAMLADWMAVIDHTGGLANAPALRAQADGVLRTRLVYEGSRLDLIDQASAPWWMMVGGDESVLRALLAVLGRPGWQDDGPRMMIGAAFRQQRGHWDTTPANAWGTLAVHRFATLYPETAIAGTTTAKLGAQTLARTWPLGTEARLLSFTLPAGRTTLMLAQAGGAGPWATVSVRAAVPLRQPLFAGYRIEKAVSVIERKTEGRLSRGDVIRVRLTIDATAERNWVVVSDPVPPGATIIGGLGGQSAILRDAGGDAGGTQPSYVERGRDAWRGYFEWVPRGRFTVEYAMRLNGMGRFNLPPTRVEAMYSPDIRGTIPNSPVAVGRAVKTKLALAATALLVATILALYVATFPPFLPSYAHVRAAWKPSEAWLYDRNGRLLDSIRIDYKARRLAWIPLASISPTLQNTVIAVEDRRFRDHGGIDWLGVAAALRDRIEHCRSRGASTLSMQVAAFLTPDLAAPGRRSWRDKLRQMRAASDLERGWSKDQILEAYLNLAGFRGETQGVAAASLALFGKTPDALGREDALLLAALLKYPNAAPEAVARRACGLTSLAPPDPSIPSEVEGRTNSARSLDFARDGRLGECDILRTAALTALGPARALATDPNLAPHLATRLLTTPGAKITTTLDTRIQSIAVTALRRQLQGLGVDLARDGAVIVVDNASGDVLAYVGGVGGGSTARQVDGADAYRQAGSTLKPFLYASAIEKGYLTPASILDDSPVQLDTASGLYVPQNYDRAFKGPVSVRTALAGSLNVPAVRTLLLGGVEAFRDRLWDTGYRGLTEDGSYYGFSLALGSAEVTLLEQAAAYRTLAQGGRWSPLRLRPGDPHPRPRPVFSPQAAWIVSDIIADGDARARAFGLDSALRLPFWAAVKTGTSKAMRDNWCIGFTDRFTVAVWIGNLEGDSMRAVSGTSGAAPVWRDVMLALHTDAPGRAPPRPAGLETRPIAFAGGIEPPRRDWFLAGTSQTALVQAPPEARRPRIVNPVAGSVYALDPDIPIDRQRLAIGVSGAAAGHSLLLDRRALGPADARPQVLAGPGPHRLVLLDTAGKPVDSVRFTVR